MCNGGLLAEVFVQCDGALLSRSSVCTPVQLNCKCMCVLVADINDRHTHLTGGLTLRRVHAPCQQHTAPCTESV